MGLLELLAIFPSSHFQPLVFLGLSRLCSPEGNSQRNFPKPHSRIIKLESRVGRKVSCLKDNGWTMGVNIEDINGPKILGAG